MDATAMCCEPHMKRSSSIRSVIVQTGHGVWCRIFMKIIIIFCKCWSNTWCVMCVCVWRGSGTTNKWIFIWEVNFPRLNYFCIVVEYISDTYKLIILIHVYKCYVIWCRPNTSERVRDEPKSSKPSHQINACTWEVWRGGSGCVCLSVLLAFLT